MNANVGAVSKPLATIVSMTPSEASMAIHHRNSILALVESSDVSKGLIEALYWNELKNLEPARIRRYLPLVTSRRVRDLLRRRERPLQEQALKPT